MQGWTLTKARWRSSDQHLKQGHEAVLKILQDMQDVQDIKMTKSGQETSTVVLLNTAGA